MADLTPAAEIREAAKLIRERAEAVPRNWYLFESQIIAVGTDRLAGSDVIATCMVPDRAAYVASMHPGVALAVADWLEAAAERADINPFGAKDLIWPAFKVAQAYLGSKETPDATH